MVKTNMKDSYKEIANRIMGLDHILIFPHVNMDGDALGSSSALCMALKALGKDAKVLISEDVPKNLDFLAGDALVQADDLDPNYQPGLALMLDCCGLKRIPGRENFFRNAPVKAVLDHHGVTDELMDFDFGRIEPASAATGELVALLIRELGVPLNLTMAEAIFTAITTDTGNFQHANTTRRTHEIAASLYDVEKFNSKKVSNLIYNRNSFNSIRLHALVMNSINRYGAGKVAVGHVTLKMLKEVECTLSESEGFVSDIMSIDGVEVGCLLKEAEPGKIRCSLRSREKVNVAAVAQSLGGGGHILAAGCRISKPMETAEAIISQKLLEQLAADGE